MALRCHRSERGVRKQGARKPLGSSSIQNSVVYCCVSSRYTEATASRAVSFPALVASSRICVTAFVMVCGSPFFARFLRVFMAFVLPAVLLYETSSFTAFAKRLSVQPEHHC